MMPCYERRLKRGKKFWVDGQTLGTRYHSKAVFDTKGEAKAWERARISEIEEQAKRPKIEVMLKDLMEERLDYLLLKKSKEYCKQNQRCFKKFLEFAGNVPLDEITRKQANAYAMHEAKRYAGRNLTVNQQIRLLKALFNFAIKNDIEITNPFARVEFYPVESKLKHIPTDEDISAVMAICNDDQKLLLSFIMETGARIGEALRLKGEDIGADYIVLYTKKSRYSNLVGRKLPRPPCLNGLSFRHDRRVFADWGVGEYRPHFLGKFVRRLKQRPWGFHSLRHLFASLLIKRTNILEVSLRLGHGAISTTQIYLQQLGAWTRGI